MRPLVTILLVFLTACSVEATETQNVDETVIEGVSQMSNKVYTNPPAMQIDMTKKYQAIIETSLGDITVNLFTETAPNTVNNFISLSRDNYYDQVIFHRVISGFMIQGGDPSGTGHGDMGKYPGYKFDDELDNPQNYEKGILAMANAGPNTNGSQFFIMHNDYPLPYQYTIFGIVINGLDIVDKIGNSTTNDSDKPLEDIVITNVQVLEE